MHARLLSACHSILFHNSLIFFCRSNGEKAAHAPRQRCRASCKRSSVCLWSIVPTFFHQILFHHFSLKSLGGFFIQHFNPGFFIFYFELMLQFLFIIFVHKLSSYDFFIFPFFHNLCSWLLFLYYKICSYIFLFIIYAHNLFLYCFCSYLHTNWFKLLFINLGYKLVLSNYAGTKLTCITFFL